jgi:hypothetical protein
MSNGNDKTASITGGSCGPGRNTAIWPGAAWNSPHIESR